MTIATFVLFGITSHKNAAVLTATAAAAACCVLLLLAADVCLVAYCSAIHKFMLIVLALFQYYPILSVI
jgi:hypothetical protein